MNTFPPFPDGLLESAAELGAITDRSARIWLRMPYVSEVTAKLSIGDHEEASASVHLSEDTDWTGSIQLELDAPKPRSPFTIDVGGRELHGRFAPSPGSRSGLTFAFGSCNEPFANDDGEIVYHRSAPIYDSLLDDIHRADCEFLFLGGDQIYSDLLDPLDVRQGLLEMDDDEATRVAALQRYRLVTRGFFQAEGFRALRDAVPTYCIWDDHDIFDNWGSQQSESTMDRIMFEAASRAYCEYQHGRNPGGKITEPPYHYTFQYGDIGFFVLDVRGCRNWESGQILGKEQWDEFVEYLNSPESDSVSTLFVASSIPVAHVSRWLTMLFSHFPGEGANAVRDRWSADAYIGQRDELLGALFEWQRARPERQVIILSGDVHVASAFTIRERENTGVIQQFVSSAFTTPLTSFERYLNVAAARGSNLFERRWQFERHFMCYENNAGLVRVVPKNGGGHDVELLIRSWDRIKERLRTSARLQFSPTST